MKKSAELLLLALLIAFSSIAYPQSLGDLAKKEQERRQEAKGGKVISDEEVAKFSSRSETPASAGEKASAQPQVEGSSSKTAVAAPPKEENGEDYESVDLKGRTESYWRKNMSEARTSVKNLENEANVLVLKLNKLQDQFYKEADGYHRETVQREIQKSYYEQDLNKANLEKARAALKDLENEARKSGALPGWIEAKGQ
jgi:hypothetical protein